MPELRQLIRDRHSERTAFDPRRRVPPDDLDELLEAARWAPTAHNMQNFEVLVVDEPATLAEIGRIPVATSPQFLRENYEQLSFTEQELAERGTGLLATMFPPSWRAGAAASETAGELEPRTLEGVLRGAPLVLIVLYDRDRRAPASAGDFLGVISLGCVLQNLWLTAESLGLGMQVMSAFSAADVERELRGILAIPEHLSIAFACRLGHPAVLPRRYLRVRRARERLVHRNGYALLRPRARREPVR